MEHLLEVFLGFIPEAIYFALFIIFTKKLTKRRILFSIIMIFEYLALKHFIEFNVLFQFCYVIMTYISLKVLYKDKAIVTDIFVFMIASLFLIISSVFCYGLSYITVKNFYFALILNRLSFIPILIFVYYNGNTIYKKYKFFWNRHRDKPVKIRSLTLRNISVIIFNLMFYIINILLTFGLVYLK